MGIQELAHCRIEQRPRFRQRLRQPWRLHVTRAGPSALTRNSLTNTFSKRIETESFDILVASLNQGFAT